MFRDWPAWVHGSVWGITGLIILALLIVIRAGEGQSVWDGWRESSGLRNPNYAERVVVKDVFRTRANTWSNLAYVLVGLYGIAIGVHDLRSGPHEIAGRLVRRPELSMLFGAACCVLGFGSGLFHASLTRLGQQIDVAAMYFPLLVILALNIERSVAEEWQTGRTGRFIRAILVACVILICGLLFIYKWSMSSFVVLTSLIVMTAVCVVIDQFRGSVRLEQRWIARSSYTLVAAVVCREMDIAGHFSSPDAWLQGHAAWHVLTSLSLASIYCYYRSETMVSPK